MRKPFTWSENKTRGKDHRAPNYQILNPQEKHGYAETVAAPTIHSLTAQHVVRHVCTGKSQTTLLKSVDQKPEDNDFTLYNKPEAKPHRQAPNQHYQQHLSRLFSNQLP